jgi:hypothetical protein
MSGFINQSTLGPRLEKLDIALTVSPAPPL